MKTDKKFLKRCQEIICVMMGKEPLTLPEITSLVNISLPIVTTVVNELVNTGKFLQIMDSEKQQAGRPPALFSLNPATGYTIGAELGRVHSNYVVLDYNQNKIYEYHTDSILSVDNEFTINEFEKVINQILVETKLAKDQLLGIGVAVPGLVQGEKGISKTYLSFENQTLQEYLEKRLGVTIRVEHDAKSMVYGEKYYGSAQKVKDAIYIHYGWGLGIGIVMNGEIYYGSEGFAGEFGHIPVIPNGELCHCGKQGCLETVSSGRAITKLVNEKLETGASSMLLKSKHSPGKVDLIDILEAANQGDQFSIEILEEAGKYLGIGIAILINIFNPGHIIIGGAISQLASYLIDTLKNNAMKHSIVQLNKNVIFEISDLKNNAGSLGVARLTSIENCCNF